MGRFRGVQGDAGLPRVGSSRCWRVASSATFKHKIAEGVTGMVVMGMVVTHPMVSINAERIERNVEVKAEVGANKMHKIDTRNEIDLAS